MHHYEFTLYVSGKREGGMQAIDSVERACQRHLNNDYTLRIIDVDEAPDEAELCRVLATPTLVVEQPPPQRRVIGCFDHPDELARVMGIAGSGAPPPETRNN
jgi:circadian clock protein KaiB